MTGRSSVPPPISFSDNDDSSSEVDVEVPRTECDRRHDGGRAEGTHGALIIELVGSIGMLIDIIGFGYTEGGAGGVSALHPSYEALG